MAVLRHRGLVRLLVFAALALGGVGAWLVLREREPEYVPGERTDGLVDTLARGIPADAPKVLFHDASAEAGIAFRHFPGVRAGTIVEDMGSGVALADVDLDGWVDALLMNVAPEGDETAKAALYRNRGDGTFADATASAGLDIGGVGMAAAFFDGDGDGDLDLCTTAYGPVRAWTNDGAGRFDEVGAAAGVAGFDGFWSGIAAGDPDRDGDVDLYVCGYVRFDAALGGGSGAQYELDIPVLLNPSSFEPERNLYLQNDGTGAFAERAQELGIDNPTGRSLGAVFADLVHDGRPDLYVANDVSDNAFFVNTGDGAFVDRTAEALLGDYRGAMGMTVCDLDGDLDLDLYITHWVGQENALYLQFPSEQEGALPRFLDFGDARGLGASALRMVGWATRGFDLDNDGQRDLFVIDGSTIPVRGDTARLQPMRSLLYRSSGAKGFFEVGAVAGDFFGEEHVGRGGATFDYDLDGDEDLLVMLHGETARLLRNDGGNALRSLRVRLRQPAGNRFALGAEVRVTLGDGRTALDAVDTQGSYLSQHAVGELSFGLGAASAVESLEVTWPDGTVESAGPFAADSLVTWERGTPPRAAVLPGKVTAHLEKPADVAVLRRFYALRDEATEARLAGELERAIERYEEALQLWPGQDDCLYYLAQTQTDVGREAEAFATLERIVTYQPRSNRAWMQIGHLRMPGGDPALDDLALAEAAFQTSHDINGEESGPIVQLGIVALLRGDPARARQLCADAAVLNPRSVPALYFAGRAAYLQGDRDAAAALLQRAHEVDAQLGLGGDSASSEGQTKSGAALVSERASDAALERWRTLRARPADVDLEYGP